MNKKLCLVCKRDKKLRHFAKDMNVCVDCRINYKEKKHMQEVRENKYTLLPKTR